LLDINAHLDATTPRERALRSPINSMSLTETPSQNRLGS